MLPNRFPDAGEAPEYNTVDAALWYFEAIRQYHEATGDVHLVKNLFPILEDIVMAHREGTRFGIGEDPADGLLRAGEPGVQLTWMDAKVGDWVVTPRIGKPVEINALWYNALRTMARFDQLLGGSGERWESLAGRVGASFGRFWNEERGYCFDVLDGPGGHEPALRPNQILAVSLAESPLAADRQRQVVEACGRHLLTSFGLRSLGPLEAGYRGRYEGGPVARDGVYHQGTVWAWLLGPFVLGHLRVYGDRAAARARCHRSRKDIDLGITFAVLDFSQKDVCIRAGNRYVVENINRPDGPVLALKPAPCLEVCRQPPQKNG